MNNSIPIPTAQMAAARLDDIEARLKSGSGSGTSDGMDGRVSKLEAHMEHVREDMAEIKTDLKSLIGKVSELPTSRDLWSWKWQWTAVCIGAIALIVGGIIGGLAWIQPDPVATAPAQPIVITLPAQTK